MFNSQGIDIKFQFDKKKVLFAYPNDKKLLPKD